MEPEKYNMVHQKVQHFANILSTFQNYSIPFQFKFNTFHSYTNGDVLEEI